MNKIRVIIIFLLANLSFLLFSQEKPERWTLSECIDYAFRNNIQIEQAKIGLEQSEINTKQARAQLFPSLSASIGQNFSNRPISNDGNSHNNYSGNYGLSAGMTIFDGGRLVKNLEQQKMQEEVSFYSILSAEKNIEMAILRVYMQILYAKEAVNVYQEVINVSQYQRDRGEALLMAGTISRADLAQLEAQLASDKYDLIVAQNTLKYFQLQLKQLLELEIEDEIDIVDPELDEEDILKLLPNVEEVYFTSLRVMPQMKSSRVNIYIAELETAKARAGYLPRVSLSASLGTNHSGNLDTSFDDQLRNNFSDGVGVTVSIPVYTNRENKSAVEKAKLSEISAYLDLLNVEKDLLQEVELAHQDAVSAQNQYIASKERVRALETSYELIEQQFNLGLKNTLELLTEKNNLLLAQQNLLQAKYTSIMNAQILNLYQDLPLEIN